MFSIWITYKKYKFILIFFLSWIMSNLATINLFEENERYCGINGDISGALGGFLMLFIINWRELNHIFGIIEMFLIPYLLCFYLFLSLLIFHLSDYGNIIIQLVSMFYGGLLFSIFVKPIKVVRWKTILRIVSIVIICFFITLSLVSFYFK